MPQFYSYGRKHEWSLAVFTTWAFMALSIQVKAVLISVSKFRGWKWWWLKCPASISSVLMTHKVPVKYCLICSSISWVNQNSSHNFTPVVPSLLVIAKNPEVLFNFLFLCPLYPNYHKRQFNTSLFDMSFDLLLHVYFHFHFHFLCSVAPLFTYHLPKYPSSLWLCSLLGYNLS